MPLAMRNLAIAQQRDRHQYFRVHSGNWARAKPRFHRRQFVYVKRQTEGTLDVKTHPQILRITQIRPLGYIQLQGKDSRRIWEQMANISPCSLGIQDDEIDVSRFNSADPTFCRQCGSRKDERNIILCDDCNDGYHIYCLCPPLPNVPTGQWLSTPSR